MTAYPRVCAIVLLAVLAGCSGEARYESKPAAALATIVKPHLYACYSYGGMLDTVLGWYGESDRGPLIRDAGGMPIWAAYRHAVDSIVWLPRRVRMWPPSDSALATKVARDRAAMREALERDR